MLGHDGMDVSADARVKLRRQRERNSAKSYQTRVEGGEERMSEGDAGCVQRHDEWVRPLIQRLQRMLI